MNPLRISVVIPVFDAEPYIAEAIESVIGQSGFNRDELEVIVIDDGSTDRSGATAESFAGVNVIRQPNRGIGAARNLGVAAASGELLAFLDADDVWPVGRLRAMIASVRAEGDVVFGEVVEFRGGGPDTAPQAARLAGSMLLHKTAFERVGAFREDVKVGEFIDWWARAEESGLSAIHIPGVVLRRRIHSSNTGIVLAGSRADYARVLRAALARRRGAS